MEGTGGKRIDIYRLHFIKTQLGVCLLGFFKKKRMEGVSVYLYFLPFGKNFLR